MGIGVIICGPYLNFCFPSEITELGQTEWKHSRMIKKEKGKWGLEDLLENLIGA
jgi:hypothetical protein